MSDVKSFKTPMLYTMIVSIVLGAVFGIFVVLRGEWDWFEMQVLITAGVVALTSVAALGCEVSKAPLGLNLMPKFGQLLSIAAGLLMLFSTWFESLETWKLNASVSILAVAVVHLSLLSVAKLSNRFRWIYPLAMQVIFGLAAILISMLVFELDGGTIWQLVAVLAILDAALTIVIPICHRIDRLSTDPDQSSNLMPLAEHSVASIDQELDKLRSRISKLEKLRSQIAGANVVSSSTD